MANEDLDEDAVKLENTTNASTTGNHSRKHSQGEKSLTTDRRSEATSDQNEQGLSSDDEEYREGTAQQYITPLEVRDHIIKLWDKEHELLGLLFGKFNPKK